MQFKLIRGLDSENLNRNDPILLSISLNSPLVLTFANCRV